MKCELVQHLWSVSWLNIYEVWQYNKMAGFLDLAPIHIICSADKTVFCEVPTFFLQVLEFWLFYFPTVFIAIVK